MIDQPQKQRISVLLVDDHAIVRAGLSSLVQKIANVEVIGEAGDGREALKLVRSLSPNVVLMDIAMAGLNGLEAAAQVTKEFPDVRVLMLSMHAAEQYVLRAFRAGAAGYVLKNSAPKELETALMTVSRGQTYLSPSISKQVVDLCLRRTNQSEQAENHESLAPRQREVLQLIAEGKSSKEIGFLLNISSKTVDTHRMRMMDRLKIHDIPGLVRYAMRLGLVPPEVPSLEEASEQVAG
jgi:DNA-binding NarL/FixJ family response regulator